MPRHQRAIDRGDPNHQTVHHQDFGGVRAVKPFFSNPMKAAT
jgi:hypothetical protein